MKKKHIKKIYRFRLSVYKSNRFIYAQIIDDKLGHTVAYANSLKYLTSDGNKLDIAKNIGLSIAKMALSSNVKYVFFDKGKYKYHGKIKSLADGARLGGLNF